MSGVFPFKAMRSASTLIGQRLTTGKIVAAQFMYTRYPYHISHVLSENELQYALTRIEYATSYKNPRK